MSTNDNITPQIIREEGAGKAYQSVAQSTALAIQDAADNLRNINTITATALGVAMAQALQDPAMVSQYSQVAVMANTIAASAAANFVVIGQGAATVLNNYPSGE